jgi:hypothetical protein
VRESESGDKAEDEGSEHLPECAITREACDGSADGDERGLAKWCSLFNFCLKAVPCEGEFTERTLHY